MPYDMHWHDDQHSILRVDIHGEVSWDGYHEVTEKIGKELAKAPHPIDIIFNDSVGMPPGNPMPHLKSTISKLVTYPNLGMIYSVSPQPLSGPVKMIINLMMRIYKIDSSHNGGFLGTMDEALDAIYKQRALATASK